MICTVIGGDGPAQREPVPAGEATLSIPNDMTFDPATGTLYVIDFNNFTIRALGTDGVVRTIAGTGELGTPVDGPALDVRMSHVGDLALDGTGNLYVAGWHNSMVLRIDLATGVLARVAGLGRRTYYTGDGGPALEADLDLPASIAVLPDGRLVITDQGNQVLRQFDPRTGTVEHLAGRCVVDDGSACAAPVACPGSQKLACDLAACSAPCTPAFAGDGGTVADLRLALPFGAQALPGGKLAIGPDGNIHVADCDNGRVRVLRPDGTVATVAGGGSVELDGVAATDARLQHPADVEVAPDGTLYIADLDASCIRRVAPDGTIDTVAGVCGQRGFAGDGGLATRALLDRPMGIELDVATNRLYIADSLNHRIRAVTLAR